MTAILLFIMLGPAIVLIALGAYLRKKDNRKTAKILFILAGVYLLVSFGTCGLLMTA